MSRGGYVTLPEGSVARLERGGTRRADAAELFAERAGGSGCPGNGRAGGRRWAEPSGGSRTAGRCDNDTVAAWVARFNREGLAAVMPRHGGGPPICYGAAAQRRIVEEAQRTPDRARDGTAIWSWSTLQCALRRAEDGLPRVSTYTIWQTLHAAGLSWQQSRTWCATGMAVRKRKQGGAVAVRAPDAAGKNPYR